MCYVTETSNHYGYITIRDYTKKSTYRVIYQIGSNKWKVWNGSGFYWEFCNHYFNNPKSPTPNEILMFQLQTGYDITEMIQHIKELSND